jgi:hypothetical protein
LAVKAYDKALRAAKRTICSEVDGIILSKDVSYQMRALRLPSGEFTSSDGEAAKHLLMTYFAGCQPIEKHHSSRRVLQELIQED